MLSVCLRCATPTCWPRKPCLMLSSHDWVFLSSTHPDLVLVSIKFNLLNFEIVQTANDLNSVFISVEMFVLHLSPKSQRIHRRDNRRGVLMMRRQKPPPSGSGKTPTESAKPSVMSSSTNKRCSSDGPGESAGPSSKRSKITWPWRWKYNVKTMWSLFCVDYVYNENVILNFYIAQDQ